MYAGLNQLFMRTSEEVGRMGPIEADMVPKVFEPKQQFPFEIVHQRKLVSCEHARHTGVQSLNCFGNCRTLECKGTHFSIL